MNVRQLFKLLATAAFEGRCGRSLQHLREVTLLRSHVGQLHCAAKALETLSTVTFEERDRQTSVTIRWTACHATELERETFNSSHATMQQGWAGTFDQFTDYLSNQ